MQRGLRATRRKVAPILKHCAPWLLSAASQRRLGLQPCSLAGPALDTSV